MEIGAMNALIRGYKGLSRESARTARENAFYPLGAIPGVRLKLMKEGPDIQQDDRSTRSGIGKHRVPLIVDGIRGQRSGVIGPSTAWLRENDGMRKSAAGVGFA